MDQKQIDWPSFIATVAMILIVCIPLAFAGENAVAFLQNVYNYIADKFGIFYLLAGVGCADGGGQRDAALLVFGRLHGRSRGLR